MKQINDIQGLSAYLYKNWFWVAVLCLLAFAFVKRDMSLSVSMNGISITTPKAKDKVPTATKQLVAKKEIPAPKQAQAIAKGSVQMINPFEYFQAEEKAVPTQNLRIDDPEAWYSPTEQLEIKFIKRFEKIAIKEMKLYGIPASIKLAQGIIGSKGGQIDVAKKANNFFNVPCENWKGEVASTGNTCVRKYQTPWMGFRDHSDYITEGAFKYLVKLGPENYHQWAEGLELGGYDENTNYAEDLVEVIEKYELYKFDRL